MENKIEDLNKILFETIEALKNGTIDTDKASKIAEVGRLILDLNNTNKKT